MINDYQIFPFSFRKIKDATLITNIAGLYLYIEEKDLIDFVNFKLVKDSNIYNKLKSNLFLADSYENISGNIELSADRLRTRKKHIFEPPALHMIIITRRCNLKCKYCHASSLPEENTDHDMDWPTLKKVISYIIINGSTEIKIEFQGGEPTLRSNLILKAIKYGNRLSKRYNKKTSFIICTNLYKLNKKLIRSIKIKNVFLSTSLDGPKDIHDKLRLSREDNCSSYDNFLKNLSFIRKKFSPRKDISPLITVTRYNISSLNIIIDHYYNLGFSSIFLRPVSLVGRAEHNDENLKFSSDEYINAFKDALRHIFDMNKSEQFFIEGYCELLMRSILTPYNTGFADIQSPTGMSTIALAYERNGDIYSSDEGRMLSYKNDNNFRIGNINQPFKELISNKKTHN
ncbi:MAG: radical SAM protein [Eubacteriales bacterium]